MYDPVQYFDEMNILKDDKLRRIKTAKEFINALVDFFAAQFMNLLSGIFLYEKSSSDYENELMDLYFAMAPEYQYETEVREKAYRFARYIQEATERAVANANGNDDYKMSRMTGGIMKEEDVPKSVKRMFSEVRATVQTQEVNYGRCKQYSNGAASAASQLAQEESNLGTAGQSAAAGQTNLNESLNQANTNPANRRIQELIDQINKYKATVSGMESGKIRFDTGQYEEAVNGLRQAQEQFKQFKETVSQSPKNMEDVAKSIKSIGDAAQKCGLGTFSSILSGIASILPAIETGGMAANAGFQSMAVGLEAVQSAIPIIGIILTILTAIINAVRQVANAVKNEAQKIISAVKTVVNKIRSGIAAIINKFKELKKRVRESLGFSEKQSGAFAKKLGSILRLGTFMLLRSMFTHLFELVKTGFDNLVIYSKRAGTEFHKNVNLLYNDLRQLGASLTTAFEPILNVVTPILDYLIQKLVAATNALAQFFSALTGKKFYTKAIRQNKDYTDSLNSAAKAAKNLTTGIDELNILSDDKSGSGSNSGADGSGYETDAVADKYKDLAEMVKDAWADADFTEIGRMFGEKLKEALENIPWDGIKATLRKIAKSIATFLNGFLETPGLFTEIGVTIAQAINSAFEFVDSFVENFHWSSLGTAIADLIIGALDTLDWRIIPARRYRGFCWPLQPLLCCRWYYLPLCGLQAV